jgi:cyclopropane-fatty-acyl-phospholipid synthase
MTLTLTLTLTLTHLLRGRPECSVLRAGFRKLINVRRSKELAKYKPSADADFAAYLKATYTTGLAVATDEANEQHYTCPTEYFDLALGEYKKYSCCVFEEGDTLEDAEVGARSTLHWHPSPRVPHFST